MSDAKNIIYGLIDPRSGYVRYVGKSRRGIKRAEEHRVAAQARKVSGALYDSTHKANWIRELGRMGLNYTIIVLAEVSEASALNAVEQYWVKYLRELGHPLTNGTAGGDGGVNPTPEVRKKMSEAHRQWFAADPTRREQVSKMQQRYAAAPKVRARLAEQSRRAWADPVVRERQQRVRRDLFRDPARRLAVSRQRGGEPIYDQHGNRYEMIASAAQQLNISHAHIVEILNGKRHHARGYVFARESAGGAAEAKRRLEAIEGMKASRREAGGWKGGMKRREWLATTEGRTYREETSRRMKDVWRGEARERRLLVLHEPTKRLQHARAMGARPFMDQLGQRFESLWEAAEKLGLSRSKICSVLKGKRPHTKGFTFHYIDDSGQRIPREQPRPKSLLTCINLLRRRAA